MKHDQDIPLPEPHVWPEPITLDEYSAFVPEKLELVDGYLIDGPDDPERRIQLLALLLKNCGLETAMFLSHKDDWREAVERGLGGLGYE